MRKGWLVDTYDDNKGVFWSALIAPALVLGAFSFYIANEYLLPKTAKPELPSEEPNRTQIYKKTIEPRQAPVESFVQKVEAEKPYSPENQEWVTQIERSGVTLNDARWAKTLAAEISMPRPRVTDIYDTLSRALDNEIRWCTKLKEQLVLYPESKDIPPEIVASEGNSRRTGRQGVLKALLDSAPEHAKSGMVAQLTP